MVTAVLASPLASEPPQLDALLEWALAPFAADYQRNRVLREARQFLEMDPRYQFKLTRAGPAPSQGEIRIPLYREHVNGYLVSHCSNPVLPTAARETVEHVNKRLAVEHAGMLAEDERKVVTTTNSWTKSYRLPLRVRAVSCIRWCCIGTRREILKALKDVKALGKKVADGYGRVARWECGAAPADYSWFAPHPSGTLLMRTLPAGDWLPRDLVGYRRDYGAAGPPYWHPERWTDIITPA